MGQDTDAEYEQETGPNLGIPIRAEFEHKHWGLRFCQPFPPS